MNLNFEGFVAHRLVRSLRRRARATVWIAISGVGIGVAALVIVLSVFNGFSDLLWDGLLDLNPHAIAQRAHGQPMAFDETLVTALNRHHNVRAAAPFVASEGFALRRPPGGDLIQAGVAVRGVRPQDLADITNLSAHMWAGTADLEPQPSDGRGTVYGILIGRGLADRLGALPGAEILLGLLPKEVLMGQMAQWRRYIVTGIFHTGLDEFDAGLVFIGLDAAQRDLGWTDRVSGVQMRLRDPFDAEAVTRALLPIAQETASDIEIIPWMATYRSLYASIRLEKWFSFLVLSLIVAVAGFNIISIQTMTVSEKRKEIGILKTLGAPPGRIAHIFTLTGMGIGLTGVALGSAAGFVLCWVQQTFELIRLPGQLYMIHALPVVMYTTDFIAISAAAVGLCFAFTRFPARDAASIDPVAALRE